MIFMANDRFGHGRTVKGLWLRGWIISRVVFILFRI